MMLVSASHVQVFGQFFFSFYKDRTSHHLFHFFLLEDNETEDLWSLSLSWRVKARSKQKTARRQAFRLLGPPHWRKALLPCFFTTRNLRRILKYGDNIFTNCKYPCLSGSYVRTRVRTWVRIRIRTLDLLHVRIRTRIRPRLLKEDTFVCRICTRLQ